MDMPVPRKRGFRSVPRRSFLFFFFHGTAFIPISKGICSTAACSIDPCISWRKKIGIYLSTMYNYFPCSPANLHSPRSLIFHDETIFERDETRRAQSPGKGLKFDDTNLRRDINLSFEFFRSPVRARCTIF